MKGMVLMKYTGKMCVSCGKKFTDTDDVVVCPECASPHHRECYRNNGRCANENLHATDFDWNKINRPAIDVNNRAENVQKEEEQVVINLSGSVEDILKQPYFAKSMKKIDQNGCTLKEILDFVHINVLYYATAFVRIRDFGKNVSFNLICFVAPPVYFASRKMWFWAILTAFLSVFLLIPFMLAMFVSGDNPANLSVNVINALKINANTINSLIEICRGADLFMRIMLCLFGNRLYYNFAVKSIKRIKAKNNEDISREQLISAGGISFLNIILIIFIMFVVTALIMLALQMTLEFLF